MKSDDGSCVMYGVEKVRFQNGDHGGWIFSDSEPDTQAMEMRFTVGSQELKVPRKITRRIANPSRASFSVEMPSASQVKIEARGPNCSGINRLYLEYKDGHLVRAQAHVVDELEPEILLP